MTKIDRHYFYRNVEKYLNDIVTPIHEDDRTLWSIPTENNTFRVIVREDTILALMPIGNWLWAFLIFVFGITYCIEKTISWVNAAADRSNTINKKDLEK